MQHFTLHIITHPEVFDGEIDAIISLMQNDMFYLHLRKPNMDETSYEDYVKLLPEKLYNRIILHSAYHLAEQYDFAGLHFSTNKRKLANDILFFCNRYTSCHSFEDVNICDIDFKQCFLSPVFDSISKQGYSAAFDVDNLTSFLSKDRKIKIIALGGIDANNIIEVQKMGFDGAAVLGAVWGRNPQKDDDFKSRLDEILKHVSQA